MLLVFDALNSLPSETLPTLLSSLISPNTSIIAGYHTDVAAPKIGDTYAPPPSTLLKYLATTILTMHSLQHVLSGKAARERSHAEPSFGLGEGTEGVIQGLDGVSRSGTFCLSALISRSASAKS